ncbi:Kinesin- protein 6 [Rhizophlyctis rosea]|nr:Kinesin- protein 6 [Rhizophlyctis rosea]
MVNQYKAHTGLAPIPAPDVNASIKKEIHDVLRSRMAAGADDGRLNSGMATAELANATTSNSVSNIPVLSTEKAKAFDIFKSGHPSGTWIDGQKEVLRDKIVEVKGLGAQMYRLKMDVDILRGKLSEPTDGTPEKEADLKKQFLEQLSRYKEVYQKVKDMKLEIEHIQHLLGQAGHRLRRDFEYWYVNVYLSTESPTATEDNTSDSTYGSASSRSTLPSPLVSSTSLTEEREAPSMYGSILSRPSGLGDGGLSNHNARRSYLSTSSLASQPSEKLLTAPGDGASAVASIKRAQELLDQVERSKSYASAPDLFNPQNGNNATPPVMTARSTPSLQPLPSYGATPPIPPNSSLQQGSMSRSSSRSSSHNASVSEDIRAFYKAREGLLRRVSGT